MPCPQCRSVNPEGARFCAACGTALTARCPACSAEVAPNQGFCTSCGTKLTPTESRVPSAETSATYAADETSQPAERRLVSVVFVDLAGFTKIAETLDAEDVRGLQEQYFEIARSVVARYGGTLEKFIGDAVMAFWGAPRAHEDDGERAVRAALEMVGSVARLRVGELALAARAAVTTGEAVVTLGGNGQGMLAGDLVNTAARLQHAAPPGGVLVDETTRRVVSAKLELDPAGRARLKGKSGTVNAWLARGTKAAPDDRGRAAGHPGPFVGRQRELDELLDLHRRTVGDRRSRLVSVIGIAGIGKSRLVWEFGRRLQAQTDGTLVLTGQAAPYGGEHTFAPLASIVRHQLQLTSGTGAQPDAEQLFAALAASVPDEAERAWLTPRLAMLLDPGSGTQFERDDLFSAWRRLFERLADAQPVVLVLEDMQWADAALLDFVEHLALWARDHRLLVVTLARPELLDIRPGWGAEQPSFTAKHLGPLPDSAMSELLTALVPSLPPIGVARVLERAGGVPLYGVEVARMFLDSASGGPGRIPETLHSLIAARIDALPQADRRVLLAASLLGLTFAHSDLSAVTRLDAGQLRDALQLLLRRELLTLDESPAAPGDGRLRFVQPVVREVAYRTLSRRERRELHLAAAEHLAGRTGDESVEAIAEHLYSSHQVAPDHSVARAIASRAVEALRLAAGRANTLHEFGRALEHLQRALQLTADEEQRAELWQAAADTARAAARFDVAETLLRRLIDWHASRGDQHSAAWARAQLASLLLATARPASALEDLESALEAITDLDHDPAGIELAGQLARYHLLVGNSEQSLAWAQRALAAAPTANLDGVAVHALVTIGAARAQQGDVESASADLGAAIDEASRLGLVGAELRARNNLAWLSVLDDPRLTIETAQAGRELAIRMGVGDMAVQLSEVVSWVAVDTGYWQLAQGVLDDVRDRLQAVGHRVQFAATEAILLALRGRPDEARALTASLEPIDRHISPQVVAGLRRARAWIAFVEGDLERARRHAGAAANQLLWADRVAALVLAARASLWLADRSGLRRGIAALERINERGRVIDAARLTLRAGAAALADEEAAGELYDRAADAWRALGLPLHLALCLVERQRLLGGASDEADQFLAQLGAGGIAALAAAPVQ